MTTAPPPTDVHDRTDRSPDDAAADDAAHSTGDGSLARTLARSRELEHRIVGDPTAFRVLSGDRPTGHLHLGHYFGSLLGRVRLQRMGVETFVVIADYQVITDRDAIGPIAERVVSLVADYLAIGLDAEQTTIFTHSGVPEIGQLMLPFLALVTDAELRRNPTVKAELAASGSRPLSGLLLTYPVHQAADILFCKANLVPVGKDQLPHVEQARLIARRFDDRFGRADLDRPVFPTPDALLSDAPLLLGTDGRKMSKSLGNTIELRATADETAAAIRGAVTDSERSVTYEPERRPEVSNLVLLGALARDVEPLLIADEIGDRGAAALKTLVVDAVNERLVDVRSRRAELIADEGHLRAVLRTGSARAAEIAATTLDETRVAMSMVH